MSKAQENGVNHPKYKLGRSADNSTSWSDGDIASWWCKSGGGKRKIQPRALTSLNNRFWTNILCGVQVVSLKAFCVGRHDQYSLQVFLPWYFVWYRHADIRLFYWFYSVLRQHWSSSGNDLPLHYEWTKPSVTTEGFLSSRIIGLKLLTSIN